MPRTTQRKIAFCIESTDVLFIRNITGWNIYSSLNSSNVAAGVKTSSSPITCGDRDRDKSITELQHAEGWVCPPLVIFKGRTNILMFHVLEQPQFSVGAAAVDQRLKRPGQLLHCNLLPQNHIVRRTGERNTSKIYNENTVWMKMNKENEINSYLFFLSSLTIWSYTAEGMWA